MVRRGNSKRSRKSGKPKEDRPFPVWLLRRADQATVALLVLLAMVSMGGWFLSHGGCRGHLIELDQAEPLRAEFEVDLNRAAWPELTQLPRIGETLARRIVDSRREEGPFLDHDDLMRVRGIGPKTLDRVRPYLRPMPDHEAVASGRHTQGDPS